ncbi:putative peptide zinc metalloprotease protein [Peribacillus deserti]|uniref:Peptide zinc metalloprotease protein n=1 Tax=Peribacillus deserti TaxID=673318 RepID=A0ABS2QCE3_9BACI|nr:M50 family metallopeptidase [Peribacillus deserti]MBM7690762.1 putative peptide zinc metalloprotease protein [Peribacillus deserti]
MNLDTMNFKGIEFIEKEDHFIIKRFKKYFRLGKNEGHMLKDVVTLRDETAILAKYNMPLDELKGFLSALESTGIIGEVPKEKQNFLFYRVPMFNPDLFLSNLVHTFLKNKFIVKTIFIVLNLVIILGLLLFGFKFSQISSSFLENFGFKEYFIFYFATITAVFIHEFGHAIACKYYGGKVEEIGFLLIFFSPALYCDVSGIWAFEKKREKIITLFAGIYVQFIIFACSSILYYFFFGYSTWLATFVGWNLLMVLSNIIPVIKLDGYWILSNLIEVPNLYEKSLKLALGTDKDETLFNQHELSRKKFIKLFGIFNISFVFVSIILGFFGIYFLSTKLEGTFKYVALTIEILMYTLTLIFFGHFLYKLFKQKKLTLKGR